MPGEVLATGLPRQSRNDDNAPLGARIIRWLLRDWADCRVQGPVVRRTHEPVRRTSYPWGSLWGSVPWGNAPRQHTTRLALTGGALAVLVIPMPAHPKPAPKPKRKPARISKRALAALMSERPQHELGWRV